jgi:hypothetical protein
VNIHPELRALRGNDTPQREAQSVVAESIDAWRSSPETAAVFSDLVHFGNAAALAECPSLSALFMAENQAANRIVSACIETLSRCLAKTKLAHVPMRHFYDGTMATLVLAQTGTATLALSSIDGAGLREKPASRAIRLVPVETWERILAGSASAQLSEAIVRDGNSVEFRHEDVLIAPGQVAFRHELRHSQQVKRVTGNLVTLRLQRRLRTVEPTREYDRDTGALLHQTAGNPQESRYELMLALLGRMQRADAVPVMTAMALEAGSEALRWQCLRECLALDTAAGFAALTTVASSMDDPLAVTAGTLRAQLVESYPQLKALEPCPL